MVVKQNGENFLDFDKEREIVIMCKACVGATISLQQMIGCFIPRSHIHGLDAGLATDVHCNPYWSVAFCIASVIIRSST